MAAHVFTLPGGDVADRVDRRAILGAAHLLQAACAALLVSLAAFQVKEAWPFYGVLALSGTARAFSQPAVSSFLPFLVPREQFPTAVAWSSSATKTATVLGPAVGGLLYLAGPEAAFAACLALSLCVAGAMIAIRTRSLVAAAEGGSALSRALEGFRFVRRRHIVLGAISLDLFAVLLGSITALLPVYARDILHVGPDGLGVMRSSLAVGAVVMGVLLAQLAPQRQPHAGAALFAGVALFGAAILVFGVSENFVVSLAALAVMGAADMVSVFVRSTVVQLGTVPAVLAGGVGTLLVVGLWAWRFPELRRVRRLADLRPAAT